MTMTMGIVLVASLGGSGRLAYPVGDDIDGESDQLGRELGQRSSSALGVAPLDEEVLALDVAQLSQPLAEAPRRRPRPWQRSPCR